MDTPITNFSQVGRVAAPDPNQEHVSVTQNLDFGSASSVVFDLATVNQQKVFGTPRTLFVDNGTNPSPVNVLISITNQEITIAPYSIGYYTIGAADKSTVKLQTNGGATEKVTVSVFNYIVPPNVWYSYGATNTINGEPVSGSIAEGDSVAANATPNPVYVGGIDRATGLFHGVSVSSNGEPQVGLADGADTTQGAIADAAWSGTGNGTIVAILKALWSAITARNGALTDQSITNLSGASEALMSANTNRRILIINNPNAANAIAVNLSGGTAALNTGGSITIPAGETIRFDSFCPTGAITVIGTSSDDVTAFEG